MAKSNKQASKPATQAPATQAPAQAPQAVALRGGPAVATVALSGKPYRTKAQHNAGWWQTITAQAASGPVAVTVLINAPHSVPAHFVGYCLRRGYLTAPQPEQASA